MYRSLEIMLAIFYLVTLSLTSVYAGKPLDLDYCLVRRRSV